MGSMGAWAAAACAGASLAASSAAGMPTSARPCSITPFISCAPAEDVVARRSYTVQLAFHIILLDFHVFK